MGVAVHRARQGRGGIADPAAGGIGHRSIPVGMPKRVAAIDVSHWHSAYDAAYLRILRDLGCSIVGVSDRDERIAKDRAERSGSSPFTDYRRRSEGKRPAFVLALGRHCDMRDACRLIVEHPNPVVVLHVLYTWS